MADLKKLGKGVTGALTKAKEMAQAKKASESKMAGVLESQQAPMTRPQGTGLPLMPRDYGMYTLREQKDLPRMPMVDKARAEGKPPKYNERMQDLLDSPKARKKVDNLINKGKDLNVQEWYGTEPLRQVALDAGRTPEQFESLMAQLASASQRNPVDKQNQMGSYLYHLSETGQLPENSLLLTNKLKKELKDNPSLAEGRKLIELPKGYGSLAQGDIFNRAVMIGQGDIAGALPPNKKLGTFYENLLGNVKPVTVDVNALRGPIIEQGDPRWLTSKLVEKDETGKITNSYKPREMYDSGEMSMREAQQRPGFWEAAPSGSEYAGFEELWQRGAKRHGIEPAEAQALGWYGSADVTALKTKPENYVDNLERLIKRTAEQTGKSPSEIMNDMVTGKGFLRKEGGAVNREESKEDMARFHKRFAMHKAIGGRVKKMAGGGRVSIFDKPVHMVDGGKIGKGVMGAVNKASRMADEKIAADAMKKAAESAGMKAPVTANKPLTTMQDFHTSFGDSVRKRAMDMQATMDSFDYKYDKGQRVFTEDSARKNFPPMTVLGRVLEGNRIMREDPSDFLSKKIIDEATGKAKRTPHEPGYKVRLEHSPDNWSEFVIPESAIKGNVDMARGGLAMAEGGNVLKGNILAGASWNSLNKTLGNELTTLNGQPTTNTSVGGATTADTYKQLMDFINGGGSFDPNATVFLQTGGVDFITGVPREEVKNNIEQIISVLDQQGVNVVLTGAPYAASMNDVINNNFDPRIDPLFEEIAAAHPNVALVESMGDILQDKSLLSDAIHPNESGTRRYNDDVMGALTTLQQRESQGQEGREAATNNPQEVEAQRPINIPDSAEIAEEKGLEDSDVISTDTALDDSDPAQTDDALNDSNVAEAIADLDSKEQEIAITEPGDNMDDYQPPQQVPIAPDYSRAYEALGGADVVNDLRDQFLGMGMNDDAIESVFSKYYPQEYEQEFAQEQFKRGGAVERESPADMARFKKRFAMHKAIGGHVKKMASGGAMLTPTKKTEGFVEEGTKNKSIFDKMHQAVKEMPKVPTSPLGSALNLGYEGYKYFSGKDPVKDFQKELNRKLHPKIDTGSVPVEQFEKFAKGGSSDEPTNREIAEALGELAVTQGKEEYESFKKPRAATDIGNRGILAPALGLPVDMMNMGLSGMDALAGLLGKPTRLSSEKPFAGSEHIKDLMNKYNMTSGEDRPLTETMLSLFSPTGMIKGAQGMTKGAVKAAGAMRKPMSGLGAMREKTN